MLVSLEHVLPEGLDLLHVTSFTIDGNPGQEEPFCEFAFQADFFVERAASFAGFVLA